MSRETEYASVRVKIYDREYTLRTTGDPERLRAVCAEVDARMRELAASSGSVDTFKVAVLAALSLLEYFEARTLDLLRYPDVRLPRYQAHTTSNDKRWKGKARNHIAPILIGMIPHQGGRILPRHAEVALHDPFLDLWWNLLRDHDIDQPARDGLPVRPFQIIAGVDC